MSFENESDEDNDRRPKTDPSTPQADSENMSKSRKRRGSNNEIGQALRQAYCDAVDETIPPEMLDLLGKLSD